MYSPNSDRDYGTLLCYASNSVGKQTLPCSFTVISAGQCLHKIYVELGTVNIIFIMQINV